MSKNLVLNYNSLSIKIKMFINFTFKIVSKCVFKELNEYFHFKSFDFLKYQLNPICYQKDQKLALRLKIE